MWTTVVGHSMSATSDRCSDNQGRGGKGKDVIRMCRPSSKMTVYCTAIPTPEQRGGGALLPDAPALLLEGMPCALTVRSSE